MSKLSSTIRPSQASGHSGSRLGRSRKVKKTPLIYRMGFHLVLFYLLMVLAPFGALAISIYLFTQNSWIVTLFGFIFLVLIPFGLVKVLYFRANLPLARLTKVAQEVAAGSMWEKAPEGRDEIGQLAGIFNRMTNELRLSLENLERRNASLATDLANASQQMSYQTTQLHTVAEVARAIASVLDPDVLLQEVTELISERFKFYHVAIYLLDRKAEYAILQATNSEAGQHLLTQGHRLKVGQDSIIGSVAAQGEPRVTRQEDPDGGPFEGSEYPYSRAELAIPLKAAEKVIGVLDAQSMEASAFSSEDIPLLSIIADQIAVAIENVRLYTEARKALTELEATHRHYLIEQWSKLVEEHQEKGYRYQYGKLGSISDPDILDDDLAEQDNGGIIYLSDFGHFSEGPLIGEEVVAPITVRGQWIGSLKLGEKQQIRQWSEEDIHLIRTVADQVGLALENSRLLEETHRRAEREHLVSQITTKLRASNDPQTILQTAMNELRQALKTQRTQFITPDEMLNPPTQDALAANAQEQHSNDHSKEVI